MRTSRYPVREDLDENQESVLGSLIDLISESRTDGNARTRKYALVGGRGWGKTTLMHCLRDHFIASEDRLYPAIIVDAATITGDIGIMGACLQALWKTFLGLRNANQPSAFPHDYGDQKEQELKKYYEDALKNAIALQTRYQDMALEMSMSPDHYTRLIHQWSEDKMLIGDKFVTFCRQLIQTFKEKYQGFILFIDDLDLAERETVFNWARAMVSDYDTPDDLQLYWVFSFDRDRLVGALSNRKTTEEGVDLPTGRSLLTKLVSYHRSLELAYWHEAARAKFQGISETATSEGPQKKKPSMAKLLKQADNTIFLSLLPGYPRGLKNLYFWLEQELAKGKKISPDRIMRTIADVNTDREITKRLKTQSAARIAATFSWKDTSLLSPIDWDHLIDAAKGETLLSDLPLPREFFSTSSAYNAAGYLEVFCNIMLEEGTLKPLALLQRMPFVQSWLAPCTAAYPFSSPNEIRSFYSRRKAKHRGTGASLFWGRWHKAEQGWLYRVGPQVLWETQVGIRDMFPTDMLSSLTINNPKTGNTLRQQLTSMVSEDEILPKNLRALLLLVEGLRRMPWQELELARQFWSPLTVARISASFILMAMIRQIYSHQRLSKAISEQYREVEILNQPETPFSEVRAISEDDIGQRFAALIHFCEGREKPRAPKEPSLHYLARIHLWEAFDNLCKHPALTALVED